MIAGMVFGAALVVAVLMVPRAVKAGSARDVCFTGFAVIGLMIAGVVAFIAFDRAAGDGAGEAMLSASGISLADASRTSALLLQSPATRAPASRVASVPSLLEGLESRLQQDPGNASGWALLAQSYAFLGEADQADKAVLRAVELGLDEADLRRRVESARRDPHESLAGGISR